MESAHVKSSASRSGSAKRTELRGSRKATALCARGRVIAALLRKRRCRACFDAWLFPRGASTTTVVSVALRNDGPRVPGVTLADTGISQSRPIFTAPAMRPEAASARARRALTPRWRAASWLVKCVLVARTPPVYRMRNSFPPAAQGGNWCADRRAACVGTLPGQSRHGILGPSNGAG